MGVYSHLTPTCVCPKEGIQAICKRSRTIPGRVLSYLLFFFSDHRLHNVELKIFPIPLSLCRLPIRQKITSRDASLFRSYRCALSIQNGDILSLLSLLSFLKPILGTRFCPCLPLALRVRAFMKRTSHEINRQTSKTSYPPPPPRRKDCLISRDFDDPCASCVNEWCLQNVLPPLHGFCNLMNSREQHSTTVFVGRTYTW